MADWISVRERLPANSEHWKNYIVVVSRSHYPTSTYDIVDAPYDEEFVTPAQYDSEQKIWHVLWGVECTECLNALIDPEDSPLNGDCVTHWMSLPDVPSN